LVEESVGGLISGLVGEEVSGGGGLVLK